MGGLTRTEVSRFHAEGFLVVADLLSDRDLQPVIHELDREVRERAERLVAAGTLSRSHDELGFERQLVAISEDTDEVARGIWIWYSARSVRLRRDPPSRTA